MNQAITIDGPSSRDLDDALWLETSGSAAYLNVYVADPASEVPVGSDADLRALEMIETRYYAAGNNPMLPRPISEDKASLRPHKDRMALAVRLHFDEAGRRLGASVQVDVKVRSAAQLHYGQVLEILGKPDHPLHGQVAGLDRLARKLLAQRRSEGALALYDLQTGLLTSEEGSPRWAEDDRTTLGQVIVQEAMIAANCAVAEQCLTSGIPVLFRNHEASLAAPGRGEMQQWLSEMTAVPRELAAQRARVLETVLERARYGTELRGHFGLAVGAYLHATSPIRRLADLVNHRQVGAYLRQQPPPYSRQQLDELAARINAWKDAQRDAKSERLKERADALLARRAAGGLEYLEPKAFSRVVKLAARAQQAPGDALCAEVARRCRTSTLQALDAYHVLWCRGEGWEVPRAEVARYIAAAPHVGISIAGISAAIDPESALHVAPAFAAAGGGFESAARRGDLVAAGFGGSKKGAEHDAVTSLFLLAEGVPKPEAAPAAPVPGPAPPPKAPPRPPNPDAIDPVSELQLYCQAAGAALPEYTYAEHKSGIAPTFQCVVAAAGTRARSEFRPNKREAKREAAARAAREIAAKGPS